MRGVGKWCKGHSAGEKCHVPILGRALKLRTNSTRHGLSSVGGTCSTGPALRCELGASPLPNACMVGWEMVHEQFCTASLMGGPAHRLATNLTEMGSTLWPDLCLPRADVEDALGVGWVRRVAPTPPSSPLSAQYKCAPSCTRLVGDFERKWRADRGAHRLSAPSVNALAVANSSVSLPAIEARGAVRMCEGAPLTAPP